MSARVFRVRQFLLSSAVMLLSACGGGGDSTAPVTNAPVGTASVVSQSNIQIASLIYSDSQRTPTGFYTETVPVFSGYVATSHLKTTDINTNAILKYELCSDDFNQALQWSETVNSNSGDNANLTGNDATDKYFEFDRLRNGTPQGYLRQRVYKCAYLSRSTVDLNASSGQAGILYARPLNAAMLKTLSEYLWQFTTYNNFGNVVLSSSGVAGSNSLTHSLMIASLTRATTTGSCDSINVVEWQHRVDTITGDMTLNSTPVMNFRAQESNGAVSVCGS
jgi:hypothetical protein